MKNRKVIDYCKNAMGAVFLLAGAFFVCSTLVSIRAVFADPVAPIESVYGVNTTSGSVRTNATSRTGLTTRASQQNVTSRARTTATTPSRATPSRNVVSRANRANATQSASTGTRGVSARSVSNRSTGGSTRTVRARTATTDSANTSRVSLSGSAIRGSRTNNSTSYTYLSSKLYTGNYSNIIDSTTGLISADAYSNCLESYYTCMDEICTARNAAQRRCACAGRVTAFAEAETALETANEELIKVSGELALLIANKGKDVSSAFQLTDAEKVMNCVSWKETTEKYGTSSDEAKEWCTNHAIYGSNGGTVSSCSKPSYCSESGNSFGFDVSNLDGSSSDILASLQSWADAKESTLTILTNDDDNVTSAFKELSNVVSNLSGITGLTSSSNIEDSLAKTWGYELFSYAHNNVCSRVLDSCFNGIYEACGTPPSGGRCATSATSSCPYNYNSKVEVSSSGDVTLNERGATGSTLSSSATCFGYSSTSGDPYSQLRGPVADARRGIMQKYLLDANADCDAYGEQLRTTAQNIGYQKVAAQQSLQQKRLEFINEENETRVTAYRTARSNFNECLSELYDCYTDTADSEDKWSTSRIKTYCQQVANVPHCYEEMVCGPAGGILEAVVDNKLYDDANSCVSDDNLDTNTCRNVLTLSEILGTSYLSDKDKVSSAKTSKSYREACLQSIGIDGVRNWTKNDNGTSQWDDSTVSDDDCPSGTHLEGGSCVANVRSCTHSDTNASVAQQSYNTTTKTWGGCKIITCKVGYTLSSGACVSE